LVPVTAIIEFGMIFGGYSISIAGAATFLGNLEEQGAF
jgi:hypothetical protein